MYDLILTRPGISSKSELHWGKVLPLGLAYLASNTRIKGFNVTIIDSKFEGEKLLEKSAQKIINLKPKLVGISTWTSDYNNGIRLAKKIKEYNSKIKIVFGGPHINALPKESLLESPEIDYVISGEAEFSLPKLVSAITSDDLLHEIPGLFFRENGNIISNRTRDKIDLNNLTFPAWDLYPTWYEYPILTERGCPFKCNFCSNNLSNVLNSRTIESVVEEIKWIKSNYSPQRINIEDETFGINIKRTELLLEEILKINFDHRIKFKAQTRVDRVNLDTLKLMKKAGFEYLELGIESGDSEVLAKSGKSINLEQVENAVILARKAGIKVWGNFIIGLIGETRETVRKTINLGIKLNPNRVSISTIVAYPGSEIYSKALEGKDGLKLITKNWASFDKYLSYSVELDTMTAKEMRYFQILAYIEIYLKNFRFIQFFKLIFKQRHLAYSLIKSYLLK